MEGWGGQRSFEFNHRVLLVRGARERQGCLLLMMKTYEQYTHATDIHPYLEKNTSQETNVGWKENKRFIF